VVFYLKKVMKPFFILKKKQNPRAEQNQAAHHIMALPFMTASFFLNHEK
jgi:hypothetical protein